MPNATGSILKGLLPNAIVKFAIGVHLSLQEPSRNRWKIELYWDPECSVFFIDSGVPMQTSVVASTESVRHQTIDLQLPSFNVTEDALAELYTFLQYLKFKYNADLEEAIDAVEEELDSLECEKALNGTEPTIAWSEVKSNLELV
jgi:hypothetical protein